MEPRLVIPLPTAARVPVRAPLGPRLAALGVLLAAHGASAALLVLGLLLMLGQVDVPYPRAGASVLFAFAAGILLALSASAPRGHG